MNRNLTILSTLALAGALSAQWTQAAPANSPSARSLPQIASNPTTGEVVLFSGAAGFSAPADTWRWTGSNWQQLSPTASPTGRAGGAMVWHELAGVWVMYGSNNTSFFGGPSGNQTWEFNGSTWTQRFPTNSPGGLALMGAAYDGARDRMVVYGGVANSQFPIAEARTWEYNGIDWTEKFPANSPGPLERPAMCFHAGIGKVVLFGGIDPQTGGTDDTWSFDGTNWAVIPVSGPRPVARTAAKMVYDSNRGVCVLHGGMNFNTGTPYTDTWEFNGTAWTQTSSPAITPGRLEFAMAMDNARRQVVAFGGEVGFSPSNQTWLYGATYTDIGAGCAGSNGVPAISSSSVPRIGGTFSVDLNNMNATSSIGLMATGLSSTSWPFGALPANLSAFGLTGCTGYTSADLIQLVGTTGGSGKWTLTLPGSSTLVGVRFFNQAASIDPGVNPASLVVSNACAGMIGG